MVHTIVVPLDGSPVAEQALEPAYRIAHRLRAAVELVHVFEPLVETIFVSGAPVLDPRLDVELRAQARRYLESVVRRERGDVDVPVTGVFLEGQPVKALAEHVAKVDGALVVMTAHGRGGISREWLGKVAEGLIRATSAPVLVIRAAKEAPPPVVFGDFGRVLVPLAGIDFGTEVIDLALEVAGTRGVELLLFHVIVPIPVVGAAEPPVVPPPLLDLEAQEAAAYEFLNALADPLRARGIHVRTMVVVDGQVAQAILEAVGEERIDLVSMATHGYRGVKRLLLGSVADKVLRSSPVPVLLVHLPEQSDEQAHAAQGSAAAAR